MLNAPLLNAAVDAFKIPDLRRKLLFTLGMLVAFRFIAHIPVPGADVAALEKVFQTNQLAGFFDLFSGGALSSLSVAALGVYPYITAQIIMQIMQPAIPRLQEIAKEGESGRQKINQWTHWLTVPLALFQAYGTPNLINFSSGGGAPIIKNFGFDQDALGTLAIIISMTAGTMLLVWMGELITQYGVGQGVSIIIFGGIMARLPFQIFQGFAAGVDFVALVVFGGLAIVTIVAIIYVYEGQRRIPVQISKQIRGNRVYGGGTTHIPLKVNSAGMIPLIFEHADFAVDDLQLLRQQRQPGGLDHRDDDLQHLQRGYQPGLLAAVFHHGRRLYLLLCAGHLSTTKYRRESAAPERVHPWHSARPADAPVPFGGAHSHHRGGRVFPGDCRRVAVFRENRHRISDADHFQHRGADRRRRCAGHHASA
jgi:preprotein translocase subunit SecY